MNLTIDKEWFEKRAAAEGDADPTTGRRKTMTLNLTKEELAELEQLVRPASPHWRCFHCDEVFYDTHSAKAHFGMDQCIDPACKIKMGAEGSLVIAIRRAEAELSDAWAAIHNESTEAAKAYYAQQSRHGEQLRAAEELGYERGLRDGRADQTPEPQTAEPTFAEQHGELRRLRHVRGLSIRELAAEIGISPATLHRAENGETVSVEVAGKLGPYIGECMCCGQSVGQTPEPQTAAEPTAWLTKIYSKDGSLLHTQLDFVKPHPGWKEKVEFIPLYAAASEGKP